MNGRYIVPVEPASGSGEVVVIEVRQKGQHPLDVQLVGCDGEDPYVVDVQHRNLGKLKHKFKGSDQEWEAILAHFLLQEHPQNVRAGILDNIKMVYALKNDKLQVSIRQDVKGIKVTLGEITMPKDEDFELAPFQWAQTSAQAHAKSLQELAHLRARASGEQATAAKLQAQLDEFIKTKNEAEKEMLQQFMVLLNEKKRKIRDQSRLLAGAKVDRSTASAVKASREDTKPRKATASRTSKRKAAAAAKAPELELEPEELPDADQMEIDEAKMEEQDDDSGPGAATPDRSSGDETEDEDGPSGIRSASPASQGRGGQSGAARPLSREPPSQAVEAPPPKRELPFGRPATRSKPAPTQPAPPAQDDETDDEEL